MNTVTLTKENYLIFDDFYKKITNTIKEEKSYILRKCNLTEEKYNILTRTKEGQKILDKVISENNFIKENFIKINVIDSCMNIIENEFNQYLPF